MCRLGRMATAQAGCCGVVLPCGRMTSSRGCRQWGNNSIECALQSCHSSIQTKQNLNDINANWQHTHPHVHLKSVSTHWPSCLCRLCPIETKWFQLCQIPKQCGHIHAQTSKHKNKNISLALFFKPRAFASHVSQTPLIKFRLCDIWLILRHAQGTAQIDETPTKRQTNVEEHKNLWGRFGMVAKSHRDGTLRDWRNFMMKPDMEVWWRFFFWQNVYFVCVHEFRWRWFAAEKKEILNYEGGRLNFCLRSQCVFGFDGLWRQTPFTIKLFYYYEPCLSRVFFFRGGGVGWSWSWKTFMVNANVQTAVVPNISKWHGFCRNWTHDQILEFKHMKSVATNSFAITTECNQPSDDF